MSVSTFNTAVCACLSPYTTDITGSKEEKEKEEKKRWRRRGGGGGGRGGGGGKGYILNRGLIASTMHDLLHSITLFVNKYLLSLW